MGGVMNQSVTIKQLKTEEITAEVFADLAEILRDAITHGASVGWVNVPSSAEAVAYWDDVKDRVAAGSTLLLVAEDKDRIVGTVQLQLTSKENGYHRGEVAHLLVHSAVRRQGIGRRLMTAVETKAWALDLALLILNTREGDPSQQLYAKLGWQLAGVIPQFARSTDGSLAGTALMYKLKN